MVESSITPTTIAIVAQVVENVNLWKLLFESVPVICVLIIVCAVLWKVIMRILDNWVKKFTKVVENEGAYVTFGQLDERCRNCQARREASMNDYTDKHTKALEDFKSEVKMGFARSEQLFGDIRQIVLITALNAGVKPEELASLTNIPPSIMLKKI